MIIMPTLPNCSELLLWDWRAMTQANVHAYQSSFREFAKIDYWAAPHAVTLTMKQAVMVQTNSGSTLVRLTREEASRNYRHFLSLLSSKILGQAAKRHGRRVNSISAIEGGPSKRLHIHAVIDCPKAELLEKFPMMIGGAWKRTSWGQPQINIKANADPGWIDYISKLRDKPSFSDSIDWTNYHNPDCRV